MLWRDHLWTRLLEIQPASVCALDAQAHQVAGEILPNTPVHGHDSVPAQPCAVALGIDVLNGLDASQARHLINQTRLYSAPRILLAAQSDCALDDDALRALGFVLSATDPAENLRIYDYDLATYKTTPDWFNARFWAHPERWSP